MKNQWLSIVLVLCMVLCLTPTTARAAEGETCTLTITVGVNGLIGSAEGTTFTFQIKKAINEVTAIYNDYKKMTVTVGADGKGTNTVSVAPGKYIVKQDVPGKPIGEYVWDGISYKPGSSLESDAQSMSGDGKSITFEVYNTYKPASVTKVTSLPITVTGYKADAKVADANFTTTESGIERSSFRFMEKDAAGNWVTTSSETFQAGTKYAIEIFLNKVADCNYDELTKDKVTVNGKKASDFEKSSTQPGGDMRVFHELDVLEVVKTVKSIKITKKPYKTEYMAGDKFDPKGMVVTAVYDDNSEAVLPVTGYTIFHGDKLTQGQTDVTIQYNDGSGSSNIKAYQKITVKPYVGSHTHTYGGSWYSDANSHWHQCTDTDCPDPLASTKDQARHTFVWKVDKAATKTQTGLKYEECTVCGHKRSENTVIPKLSGSGTATPGTTIPGTTGGTTGAAKSPKTGDAGIALYAGLSLLALSGSGWVVGKKRRGEK